MVQFQSKVFAVAHQNLRPKRHDSTNRIIVEITNNSRTYMPASRRNTLAVSFLPQVLRFPADFWADALVAPNRRHGVATPPPQIWIGS
jgi:hypothetical protein